MTKTADDHSGRLLLRLVAVSTGAAVGLVLVGYWPTVALAGAAALAPMLVGIGIGLAGAWVGLIPPVLWLRNPPEDQPVGILMGLAARFGVTAGLAVAVWLTGALPERPLLLWAGLAHLVLLLVDVVGLTRLLRRAGEAGA